MTRQFTGYLLPLFALLAAACGSASDAAEGTSAESAFTAPRPQIYFSMQSYEFPSGDGGWGNVVITATTIDAYPTFALTGPDAKDFYIGSTKCSPNVGTGGQSCTLDVAFDPPAPMKSSYSATLTATGKGVVLATVALTGS